MNNMNIAVETMAAAAKTKNGNAYVTVKIHGDRGGRSIYLLAYGKGADTLIEKAKAAGTHLLVTDARYEIGDGKDKDGNTIRNFYIAGGMIQECPANLIVNSVCMTGRTVADPRIATSGNGTVLCDARFAVARPFARDTTDFVNTVAFDKTAKFMESYVKKGTKMELIGRLQTSSYDSQKLGRKVTDVTLILNSVSFAESKNSSSGNSASAGADNYVNMADGVMDVDSNTAAADAPMSDDLGELNDIDLDAIGLGDL